MNEAAAPRERRPRTGPRGRSAEPEALADVQAALGALPLRRDLLIEHLHALQDAHGALRARHLVALAALLRLAPVEVFEVASFYAHFEVLENAAPQPPPLTIRICDGLPCAMAGADALLAELQAAPPAGLRVLRAPCMGACHHAPACALGHGLLEHATSAAVAQALAEGVPPSPDLAAPGDYAVLRAVQAGRLSAATMLARLEQTGLRGMGGAGFPAARKWRLVLAQPAPRHLVVNADEGEPGTFKDRHCLETGPRQVLEGMLLAAEAIGAAACWIYLRDEYAPLHAMLRQEIAALEASGLARMPVHLRRGAGAYICGEETALLESLEGRRGWPRHKPPFPGEAGLFGLPTLIHNVETLWWLPELLGTPEGAARFAATGRRGRVGMRLLSVSGRVRRPGVVLAPAGITAAELIEEFCGGMAPGHRFAAYLPGGASGGILPASMADLPLDFGTLEQFGSFTGSGAVVVLSDQDDLPAAARNLLRFFRDESCGQCTPCRVGTAKAVGLLAAPRWDRALLEELAGAMADGSICGLGQAAMNPVRSLLRHFPEAVP
ncbi:NADH-ubiquinone oxidoreductase-F iron-sulfur binding region domain-containing protein [Siccirubricoccus sp. G192]|uniref:NADH-ubiquinone oxidoreductase-F iron-sulfur binding region domain-containing protein n=1 Tax=Siccirubricoccus sp. G192 TaxID=2849651 RepID=UPI001C2BCF6C|nr:NADH-ubiquinone oxidoreductase-F iron-sulfur binding region domain-containing protein [Siccirubricoccus sp. G192]MBV1797047.1 NAD(P)H-dependent oxidoreductase subunit E [Siccirubricoccus sp. G192]